MAEFRYFGISKVILMSVNLNNKLENAQNGTFLKQKNFQTSVQRL
jgi:hypothetical protein